MGFQSMDDLLACLGLPPDTRTDAEKAEAEALRVRRNAIMDRMRRYDDKWGATLYCSCNRSFSWKGFDNRLYPWLDAHASCHEMSRDNA